MKEQEDLYQTFHIDAYAFYDAIVKSTEDYIYIVDMTSDIALVSDNMYHDFDLPGKFVQHLVPLWGDLIHEKDKKRYYESIEIMMSGESESHNVEYQIRNRRNEYVWVLCRGILHRDKDQQPTMFAGVVTLIGSKGKVDPTTGLFTQEVCRKRVEMQLENKTARGGLLLIGIDDFKRINNLKNHTFGDMVLRKIAQDIQQLVPEKAEVFRFDGDEGAVFYPDASVEEMQQLYQKIHLYANREHSIDGISYFCTISGGIAMLGKDGDNYLDLIKYAMSALEASKKRGKNMCTVFTWDLIRSNMRMMDMTNQLQHCVVHQMKGFYMVYQPFVAADGNTLKGAEALLRWASADYTDVGPAEFIPLLESCGSIVQVGNWVLEQAIKTCREWVTICPEFIMNINVSYLQIIDKDFLENVKALLQRYELASRHIVLELTESYFVTDMPLLNDVFQGLRELGILIAMDDFGTGYSSLGMLAQMPADIVKIDRVFISFINDETHMFNRTFIKAVIALCHSVGISVCVEGVEALDELHTVCSLHADSIQGYYISKPIPQDIFKEKYLNDSIYL